MSKTRTLEVNWWCRGQAVGAIGYVRTFWTLGRRTGRDRPMMPDPCTQKEKRSKSTALQYDHPVREGGATHSIGPNIRIPRTCVSLPFIWFARTITWSIYACIGLLKRKVWALQKHIPIRGEGKNKAKNAQSLAVVTWLWRDVECDPPVWAFERHCAHFL